MIENAKLQTLVHWTIILRGLIPGLGDHDSRLFSERVIFKSYSAGLCKKSDGLNIQIFERYTWHYTT